MPTLRSFRNFVTRASTQPAWQRDPSSLHMPDRFSQNARMASFLAHEHAFRSGTNCVDTDSLVLALLDHPRGLAALENGGANVTALRQAILSRKSSERPYARRDPILPRSSGLHKAWSDAHLIADREGSLLIEPEHLLQALMVVPNAQTNIVRDLIASGFRSA